MQQEYSTEAMHPDIFEHGTAVLVLGVSKALAEPFVQAVRALAAQPVDWHFFCGRVVVRYLGDREAVVKAIEMMWPMFRASYLLHVLEGRVGYNTDSGHVLKYADHYISSTAPIRD